MSRSITPVNSVVATVSRSATTRRTRASWLTSAPRPSQRCLFTKNNPEKSDRFRLQPKPAPRRTSLQALAHAYARLMCARLDACLTAYRLQFDIRLHAVTSTVAQQFTALTCIPSADAWEARRLITELLGFQQRVSASPHDLKRSVLAYATAKLLPISRDGFVEAHRVDHSFLDAFAIAERNIEIRSTCT